MRPRPRTALFCFLKKLSGVRKLTTFYLTKNYHRWVTFIALKTVQLAALCNWLCPHLCSYPCTYLHDYLCGYL